MTIPKKSREDEHNETNWKEKSSKYHKQIREKTTEPINLIMWITKAIAT